MEDEALGRHVMEQLGIDTHEELYEHLNHTVLRKILGHQFTKQFNSTTLTFIRRCYPTWRVCSWKFAKPLQHQWTDIENRRFAICDYIKEQEGWTCREDFYKLNIAIIEKHLGKGFLDRYKGRIYDVLMDLMPPRSAANRFAEDTWFPWKIGDQTDCARTEGGRKRCRSTPKGLWDTIENHKWYVEWLCRRKGYSIPDDLCRFVKADFQENYGLGMLVKQYDTCVSRCLQALWPEYIADHLQWFMFKRKPTNSCANVDDFPRAMKYLREKAGWTKAEQFYELGRQDFAAYDMICLLRPYPSLEEAVITLNPDIVFDKTLFHRHKTERMIMKILDELGIAYKSHYTIWKSSKNGNFQMDIYIPSLNLILEIDGCQHFEGRFEWFQRLGWKVNVCRDVFKMKEALAKGLSVLRIVQMEAWNGKGAWFQTHVVPHIHAYDTPIVHYITTTAEFRDIYTNHELYMKKEILEEDLYA